MLLPHDHCPSSQPGHPTPMQKPWVAVSMQWNVGQVVQSPYWPMKPGQAGWAALDIV
jgi:hypothetical protein